MPLHANKTLSIIQKTPVTQTLNFVSLMADMIKKQEVIFITKKYNIEDVNFKKKIQFLDALRT